MNKKIVSITLISIFILAMVPSIAFSEDRSYTINKADIQLFVQSDGLLHVKESLFFSFSGEYNGVYRDIPLKPGQSLKNINVTTKGAYSSYEVNTEGEYKKIKVYLYSDPEKTKPITDRDVEVRIEYDFVKVINVFNDVGELHYKIWGEEWDVPVDQVTSTVHFNSSSDNIKFWVNPIDLSVENSTSNSTITLKTDKIYSGDYFEIRAVVPLSNFDNPIYANRINSNGLAKMEKIQQEYVDEYIFIQNLYSLIAILIVLVSVIIPISIYLKYGREPKIRYSAKYEREPPTNDPPALVNALVAGAKDVGEPNIDGFQATIMDLINRKVFSIVPKESEGESLKLICNPYSSHDFNQFELKVISFLRSKKDFSSNIVDLKKLTENLDSKRFGNIFNSWKKDLKTKFLGKNSFKKYFIDTGSQLIRTVGNIFIYFSLIVGFLSFIFAFLVLWNLFWALLFMLIVGIICRKLSSGIGGRWTEYGKEYDAKWKNFKKYLSDFSLMKEYPPESIAVWNEYLVYATALGVADKVIKAMKFHLPAESIEDNSVYRYRSYEGYSYMTSNLQKASNYTETKGGSGSYSGGSGDVGGGSGGGGGGAF